MKSEVLEIVEYTPDLAPLFKSINEEWIREMFVLEEVDQKVLDHPQQEILDGGGTILFVRSRELGIVGTGALKQTASGEFELTKMGVLRRARGRKAGDRLLAELILRAQSLNANKLYLLTNKKCEAAIHLYLRHGFKHDPEVLSRYGSEYDRCDVAMRRL